MKYLSLIRLRYVHDLYWDNYPTLIRAINEDLNIQREILCARRLEKSILLRSHFFPPLPIDTISIKITAIYFVKINELILKSPWKGKRPKNRQHSTIEKEQSWRRDITQLQALLYKATIIRTDGIGSRIDTFINGTKERAQK